MAVRLSSRELFQWEVGGPSILGVPRGPSPATGPASLLGPVPSLMAVDVAHFSFLQERSLEAAPPRLRALPFLPRPAQPSVQCQSPLAYTGGGQRVEPRLQPPSPPSLLPSPTFCPHCSCLSPHEGPCLRWHPHPLLQGEAGEEDGGLSLAGSLEGLSQVSRTIK